MSPRKRIVLKIRTIKVELDLRLKKIVVVLKGLEIRGFRRKTGKFTWSKVPVTIISLILTLISLPTGPYLDHGLKMPARDPAYRFEWNLANDSHVEMAELEAAFRQIGERIGLPSKFRLEVCRDIPYCRAFDVDGVKVFRYNPYFVKALEIKTGSVWPSVFILAHEAGHIFLTHPFFGHDSIENHKRHELEANEFAGFTLARLGATREEAGYIIKAISYRNGASVNPSKELFLASINTGWEKGIKN